MKTPIHIVRLPTKDKPTNGLQPISCYSRPITRGGLFLPITGAVARRMVAQGHQAYHLYITVSGPIKEGDWFIHTSHGISSLQRASSVVAESIITEKDEGCWMIYCRKIIATTDPKLNCKQIESCSKSLSGKCICPKVIPQLQQSFLKEYVDNLDGEFEVEYEFRTVAKGSGEFNEESIKTLKLNQDNTISIFKKEKTDEFNVVSYTIVGSGGPSYTHWSDGLKMIITKDGNTIKLIGSEIEELVNTLPRTMGGRY